MTYARRLQLVTTSVSIKIRPLLVSHKNTLNQYVAAILDIQQRDSTQQFCIMQLSFLVLLPFFARVQGFVGAPSTSFLSTRGGAATFMKSAVENVENAEKATHSDTMVLFSPCKINLFLRILRKRPDGFHDLASLFQAIGFGDTLELTPLDEDTTTDEFTCNMEGVPTDSSNLVLRALALMREKTGVKQYFKANLVKQVPAQAGLGGGSANAATAMWGANELMERPASLEEVSRHDQEARTIHRSSMTSIR